MLNNKINLTESGGVTYTSVGSAVQAMAQSVADNLKNMGWTDNSTAEFHRLEMMVYGHTKIRVSMSKKDNNSELDVSFYVWGKTGSDGRRIVWNRITPTKSATPDSTYVYSWSGCTLASYNDFGDNFILAQDQEIFKSAAVINRDCGSILFTGGSMLYWSQADNAWIQDSHSGFTDLNDVVDDVVYAYRTSVYKFINVNGFSVLVSPSLMLPPVTTPTTPSAEFSLDYCSGKSRLIWFPTIIH